MGTFNLLISFFGFVISAIHVNGLVSAPGGSGHNDIVNGYQTGVPLFMWSKQEFVPSTVNEYITSEVYQTVIAENILTAINPRSHKAIKSSFRAPTKHAVVMLVDELSMEDVAMLSRVQGKTELGAAFDAGKGSVVMTNTLYKLIGSVHPYLDLNKEAEASGVKAQKMSSVKEKGDSIDASLFVVHLSERYTKTEDHNIGEIVAYFDSKFGSDITYVFTGLKPIYQAKTIEEPEIEVVNPFETIDARLLQANNSTDGIRNDPNLMSGMLISLMLVVAVSIYLCCLDCVQTPQHFATRYPLKGKEFN